MPRLETSRLILRDPELADAPAIQSYFNDWEIIRWLRPPVPWPYPDNGAETYLQDCLAKQGVSQWIFHISLKSDDTVIGSVGIRLKEDEKGAYAERGFALSREKWGQGIMDEASRAVSEFAFTQTRCLRIVAFNALNNHRSHDLKKRQGFTHQGSRACDVAYHGGSDREDIWELQKATWLEVRT